MAVRSAGRLNNALMQVLQPSNAIVLGEVGRGANSKSDLRCFSSRHSPLFALYTRSKHQAQHTEFHHRFDTEIEIFPGVAQQYRGVRAIRPCCVGGRLRCDSWLGIIALRREATSRSYVGFGR